MVCMAYCVYGSEKREQDVEDLERHRSTLGKRGMEVPRSKINYTCLSRGGGVITRSRGGEGERVHRKGECGKEVKGEEESADRVEWMENGWK